MADEFNPQGFTVKTGEMAYWLVWIASIFMKELNLVLPMWDKPISLDHSKTERVLGIQFRPVK